MIAVFTLKTEDLMFVGFDSQNTSALTERLSFGAEVRDLFGFFRGQIRFPDYSTLFIG